MPKFFTNTKKNLVHNLLNIPGWRTKRKIVVLESDDWGSIRMPSGDVFNKFLSKGFSLSDSVYNKLDTLESDDDLYRLYEVLESYRDSSGKNPVITGNVVVGNPDFEKIKQSDFNEYYYEPVSRTFERYPGREKALSLWLEGAKKGIFHPQYHSREHVNVTRWMDALRRKSPEIMFSFENGTTFSGEGDYNFMEVLDYNSPDEIDVLIQSLQGGLDLFEEIFGFRSKSFIPPCYTWDSNIEKSMAEGGVKFIQGIIIQSIPTGSFGNYKKKYHFLGSRNSFGQYFLVRNCFFEPSLINRNDPVGECLRRISIAFRWNKPAIIGSHRINYMGSLNKKNRTDNLYLLNELLSSIIKIWPDVEFMSSDRLGELIVEE